MKDFPLHDSDKKRHQCPPPLVDVTFVWPRRESKEGTQAASSCTMDQRMDQGWVLLTARLAIIQGLVRTILVSCCFHCEFHVPLDPPHPRQSDDWEWAEAPHLHSSALLDIFPPGVCLARPLIHVYTLSQHTSGSRGLHTSANDMLKVHHTERR